MTDVERMTTDDLRGMLPSEIVERFDDLRAKLAASEAARAALVDVLSRIHDGLFTASLHSHPGSKHTLIEKTDGVGSRRAFGSRQSAGSPGAWDGGSVDV